VTEIAAVVLAAGEGRRLRPLTETLPKALCPIGNVALLDRALARLAGLGMSGQRRVAVNAHHLRDQVIAHVGDRAHLSVEPDMPLGTAGGLGGLRSWIDGRAVLVGNADAYLSSPHRAPGPDIAALLNGWDGTTVRLLCVPAGDRPAEFGNHRFAGFSLLPWSDVVGLAATPANLVRTTWRPAERAGRLEIIEYQGVYLDTGTPGDYLEANLHAAGDGSLIAEDAVVEVLPHHCVIGSGARVLGRATRAVVWPGGYVGPEEQLVDAIRAGKELTVAVGVPTEPVTRP